MHILYLKLIQWLFHALKMTKNEEFSGIEELMFDKDMPQAI